MTTSRFTVLFALALSPLVAMFGGCGGPANPDGRQDVSGTITLNGNPISAGTIGIRFEPKSGGDGGGFGQVSNGEYLLTGDDGVKPGLYIVRIAGTVDFDISTGKLADSSIVFGNEIPVDLIPPEFNRDSNIEFEVTDGGANRFDLDIKTDYVPKMPANAKAKVAPPI